ncbi:12820_t:CDS:2 [Racocetra fulgida]|uniref:12820_t:CDS:1 n=1 Tax=Racocetra fulgida TaxID=60492 RepID=A0A9N9AS36_9GLOM|nr:12820_t:CDS:2 [Racocetra fulgida]
MPQLLEVTEYDVIILGTGYIEIGKSVLHLDSNNFYGGNWSSLNFRDLLEWTRSIQGIEGKKALVTNFTKVRQQAYSTIEYEIYTIPKQVDDIPLVENEDSETDPKIENYDALARFLLTSEEYEQSDAIANVITEQFKSKILVRTRENEEAIAIESSRLAQLLQMHKRSENMSEETLPILLKESKRYNLDLAPKFVSCRGELIELLISSGVARYLEFKAMDKTYIYSIDAFDKKFKIDGKLLMAVLYAIALIRTNANDGLEKTQRYLRSLGRYGNTAFLVGLYGCGSEIAQGFSASSISSEVPENIILAGDPDSSLDFEEATIQARQFFEKMCPGEEFLPAGPDPDEEEFFV